MVTAAPNIDDQGVVIRLRRSVYAFAGALLLVALFERLNLSIAWYLIAVPAFWGAFSLAYQGLFKT
jgi:hypothetical protein